MAISMLYPEVDLSQFNQAIRELTQQVINTKKQQIRLVQPLVQEPAIACIDWLENQPHFPKFYWLSRNGCEEVVALGKVATFSDPELVYDSLLEDQRVWGGQPFDGVAENNAFFFFLPQIELSRFDNKWSLCVNLNNNKAAVISALNALIPEAKTLPAVDATITAIEHSPEQMLWHQQVNDVLGKIEANHFKKVVLARKSLIRLNAHISAAQLLKASKTENRHSFHFLFAPDQSQTFIGSTPERLYRRDERQLETEALAGTIGRGEDDQKDLELADWLVQDAKNLIENQYVVDDIVERLTPYIKHIEIQPKARLVQFRKVQHLKRKIRATLKSGINATQLLAALQPTAAVAGLPRKEAIQYIKENEPFVRGWYSGSMGYISHQKAEFCVAIRSALINHDGVYLFTGAGIVKGSEADAEWLELERKMATLLFLFKGSHLFQSESLLQEKDLLEEKRLFQENNDAFNTKNLSQYSELAGEDQ